MPAGEAGPGRSGHDDAELRRAGATSGLDDLGGGGKGVDGILAHCSVAINAACPDSLVAAVCDREGDFWALLAPPKKTGGETIRTAAVSAKEATTPG